MAKHIETEVKVGIFLTTGLSLIMIALFLLGGGDSFLTKHVSYTAHFNRVDGLITGAKVILSGLSIGTVEKVEFDPATRDIKVKFSVEKKAIDWIRQDSAVEIATQGVLGDKYLSIDPGTEEQPALPAGANLPNRPTKDLSQFINKGDQLIVTLNSLAASLDRITKSFEADHRNEIFFKGLSTTAKNFALISEKLNKKLDQTPIDQTISNLNQIFRKINDGTGSLGAIINDPSLYDEMKALFGGVNRNRIIRNLVRQTVKNAQKKNSESTGAAEKEIPNPAPSQ